jgi:hypothetical protein
MGSPTPRATTDKVAEVARFVKEKTGVGAEIDSSSLRQRTMRRTEN